MESTNVETLRRAFMQPTDRAKRLLHIMAQEPVKMKRYEAQNLRRAIFGPVGLRSVPRGRARQVFRLPNCDDVLVLDYAKPSSRFGEPSWVTGRVERSALRIVLRPRLRLDRLVSPWFPALLRMLRISRRGGLTHAA
jgi:hypothetical protein